jgi:tetratricopeptide (TPR) repeat protein
MGADARIMLLSHYAFDRLDNKRARGYGLKQSHPVEKTTTGHVIFSGAGLNHNSKITVPHQLDIVPTLLASSSVAIPSTLGGRIWQEVFSQPIVNNQQQTRLNKTKNWPVIGSGLSQQDILWLAELSAMGMVDPLTQKIKLQRATLDRERMVNRQLVQVTQGDISGACVTLSSWLKRQPHDIEVKLELVNLLFFTNQNQALVPIAKNALIQLQTIDEGNSSLLTNTLSIAARIKLLQAAIAFTEQEDDSAIRQLRKIDFSSIQDATIQTFAGNCFLKLKSFKEAEVLFQRAVSINSGFGPAYTGLSHCLYEQKKYALVIEVALKAVELQVGDFASHRILGLTFESLTELELAELHYSVFLQRHPNDSDIKNRLQTIRETKARNCPRDDQ